MECHRLTAMNAVSTTQTQSTNGPRLGTCLGRPINFRLFYSNESKRDYEVKWNNESISIMTNGQFRLGSIREIARKRICNLIYPLVCRIVERKSRELCPILVRIKVINRRSDEIIGAVRTNYIARDGNLVANAICATRISAFFFFLRFFIAERET